MPGGAPPPPTPGVAAALGAMFDLIDAAGVDVVSQHAFDAPAFDLARDLPVLHTLHLPPIVEAVVSAARHVPSPRLGTVSRSCQASWQAVGVEVPRVLRNGVGDMPVQLTPSRAGPIAGPIPPQKWNEHAIPAARAPASEDRLAGGDDG